MIHITGTLRKMQRELQDPVVYRFIVDDQIILLNDLLEKKLSIRFMGQIYCIQCGRKTSKSFQQGYCFPCLRRLQECHLCIIHPERCRVEEGTCPTDDWAHQQCHQKHVIYLANTSGLKVGVTRHTHILGRWIDQGATQGLIIYQAANRYQAGMLEIALKKHVSDRTQWQMMIKQEPPSIDLSAERDRLLIEAQQTLQSVLKRFESKIQTETNSDELNINYPITQYPAKIHNLSLDKTPLIEGMLLGVKGQYLILDVGVINIRKFGGYRVEFAVE